MGVASPGSAIASPPPAPGAVRPLAFSGWLLGARLDLLLIIATPLLALPLLLAVHTRFRWEEVALFVGAFGAMGHHLPGMMRAYGDRALFHRFRTRFVVAPIALVAISIYSGMQGLGGVFLLAYAWAIWHAVMQTYGMARIYDAKVAPRSTRTGRLDWLLCIAWFGAGTLASPVRIGNLLSHFYASGGFFVPPEALAALRLGWAVFTAAVSVAWCADLLHQWRSGRPISGVKLLLLAVSCSFWWYTTVSVTHMLVGVALWEICHDVQYLTIVWVFNRGRVARDPAVGAFTRFLFRGSPALVGAYVGLVLGYGALGWFGGLDHGRSWNGVLEGLLIASGLLHFYYDGFIWKMRDRDTGSSLALREDAAQNGWRAAGWPRHAAGWGLLLLPVAALAAAQTNGLRSERERVDAVLAAVPAYTDGWDERGRALLVEGRDAEAEQAFEHALSLQPDHAKAAVNLLLLRAKRADAPETKIALYQEALGHRNDPRAHQALAVQYLRRGERDAARVHLEAALAVSPDFARAHFGLATLAEQDGALVQAVRHYEAGLRAQPEHAAARAALGLARLELGETGRAREQLEAARALAPEDPRVQAALALARARGANAPAAKAHYQEALRLAPGSRRAAHGLAWLLATSPDARLREPAEALRLAERLERAAGVPDARTLDLLAAARANAGDFEAARSAAARAAEYAAARGEERFAQAIRARLALYSAGRAYREAEPAVSAAP